MARTVWKSADGNFNSANSWTNGIPGVTAVDAIMDGSQSQMDVKSGFDLSSNTFRLITTPQYRGNIGSEGNPLQWIWSTYVHCIRGSGAAFLKIPSGGATSSGARILIDSSNRVNAVTMTGIGDDANSLIAFLMCKSGKVFVRGNVDFGSANTSIIMTAGQSAHVVLNEITTTEDPAKWLICYDGIIDNSRALASNDLVYVSGGTFIQRAAVDSGQVINIGPRGTFRYIYVGDTTLPNCTIDGTLDLSGVDGDVTTSANYHVITPNGQVIPPSGDTVSSGFEGVTNAYDLSEEYPA